MLILSFEPSYELNHHLDYAGAVSFINERILSGEKAFRCIEEVSLRTQRFPEGHIYPKGTILLPSLGSAPEGVSADISSDVFDVSRVQVLRSPVE